MTGIISYHEYPRGLAGEAINICARIVAITDVFDALTSSRPYKEPWPLEQVIDYMVARRGKHFDPRLVDLFLNMLPEVDLIRRRWQDEH